MGELEIRLNDLDKRIVLTNKLIEDLIDRMRKYEIRLENFESVLKQGFDSIATYFSKMNQGEFAIDLRKLLKRLLEQSGISIKPNIKKRHFKIIDFGHPDPTFEAGGLSITNQKVRCPHCGNEFIQRVESGCFYNNIEPKYCPKCGFPDIKINAPLKEQEQNPSAKKAIEMILNDLRITCLGCNKSYKFADLKINTALDKIYCPDCKHEFKTLKIRR